MVLSMCGVAEVRFGHRIHCIGDIDIAARFYITLSATHEAGPSNAPKGIMKESIMKRKQMSVVYLLIISRKSARFASLNCKLLQ